MMIFAAIVASCVLFKGVEVEGVPNFWVTGCSSSSNGPSVDLPFCDYKLPIAERVKDLVARLTDDEKLGLLGGDHKISDNSCVLFDSGVPRLGIPAYMNLVEANTAVNSACYAENVCATNFPSPAALASSFNSSLWNLKGSVISEEMRALSNANWVRFSPGSGYGIGLTGFGPNINLARDPRWGRCSEVPSEDPLLAGSYATEYVRGMQQEGKTNYLKMISGLKHYVAYSVENDRGSFIPNITDFDLWDSYLPHFKMGFQDGGAQAVMTSYSGVNGVPSCDNSFITNTVVRKAWSRPDVLVGTDCGAISDSLNMQMYATSAADAAAKAILGGTDLDLGDDFFAPVANGGNGGLAEALATGTVSMTKDIDPILQRLFTVRFKAGLFDPLELQPYTQIPISVVNASLHQDAVFDAALQSFVLLKNDGPVLPFTAGRTLAVLGPHVNSTRDLFESYMGDQVCYGGGYACVPTIGDVFTALNSDDPKLTTVVRGVDLESTTVDRSEYAAALQAARDADQVVLVMGLGNGIEYETHDRETISLPGLQEPFVLDVLAARGSDRPTVLVLINGGVVAIDRIEPHVPSIVEAWYPAQRGAASLFHALFGRSNRFGKLPVTIYKAAFVLEQQMHNFDMTAPPGRTYRYYTNPVTFPFGFGLSYTNFTYDCTTKTTTAVDVTCVLANVGSRDGDEVLQVYHQASDALRHEIARSTSAHPVPKRSLVGFQRQFVQAGGKVDVPIIAVPLERLALTNNQGDRVLYKGTHHLIVTNGVMGDIQFDIMVDETVVYPAIPK